MSESSATASRPPTPVTGDTAIPSTAKPYRFNWEASRRPGPESVSGTTSDGRGHDDYFNAIPQLGNLHLNTSTTSLALGSVPTEWSSSRHGFNAISTVLNNPHKQQAPPKAHSALPAVPAAELPRVRRKDFDPYLESISAEWDRFEHTHQPEAGPSTLSQLTSPSTLSAVKSLPSLEAVPRVFFAPDFDLADPKTFAAVTELDGDDAEADPAALAHSLPLMEKLSHYADTVEMHLTHEISLRSSSFFAALSNLHHLQAESTSCLTQISRLRDMLKEVDEDVAKRGLKVIQLERQMQDIKKVEEGVVGVKGVVDMSGNARSLLAQGKWGEALGVVDALEKTWTSINDPAPPSSSAKPASLLNGRLSPLPPTPEESLDALLTPDGPSLSVPLSSLRAFSALPGHLRSLTMEIVASLSTDFSVALRNDLMERVYNEAHGLSRNKVNERLKVKVEPLLEGLVRTKGIREATLSWRETVLAEMGNIVRKNFPSIEGDGVNSSITEKLSSDGSESRPGLGAHLREMPHSDFMNVLYLTYKSLLKAIEGLQTQGTLVGEVVGAIYSLRRQSNPDTLQLDFTDILGSATELAHVLVSKVIATRSDQHTSLPLHEFCEFFNATWSFVIDCEVLCRRMVVGLRGAVVGQGKAFLQVFHQTRLNQSAKLVEDELWNPRDVPTELQHIVDLLVDSAVKDAPELVLSSSNAERNKPDSSAPTSPNSKSPASAIKSLFSSPASSPPPPPATSKNLHIEDRTYFTVAATSEVLTLLLDYLKVIVNLGMLVTDTMSRVIEFLKAFNSRTCQVVLGAGAMRSAGLKNITAKHLALASQSLSIMVALIPYVRETFRRHLSSKQAVMLVEFDKLKRDYQEHQNEIHAKLIAIMGDRLSAHVKTLKAVDWTVPKAGGGVNDYMELLVKETVTLHKVLSRYLSNSVVQDVMTQVFAAINHRLSGEYTKLELPHAEAKDRLLADARFLHKKLAALNNVGVPSNMLEIVISEKSLPGTPRVPTPTRSQTLPSGNAAARSSTNLRLKGLLSGKGLAFDKALPTPIPPSRSSMSSPPPLSSDIKQSAKSHDSGDASPLPALPVQEGVTSQISTGGFKEIEASVTEPSDSEAAGTGPERITEITIQPTESRPSGLTVEDSNEGPTNDDSTRSDGVEAQTNSSPPDSTNGISAEHAASTEAVHTPPPESDISPAPPEAES